MNHDHDDTERLTFGCAACVERAEEARWLNAPVRRCRWYCSYDTGEVGATLSFALDVRVPDGTDQWKVDDHYAGLTGEAFVTALPDCVPMDVTAWAVETMEVERVDIGPIVRAETAAAHQLDMFGGDAA
jgi:hypothetical protein